MIRIVLFALLASLLPVAAKAVEPSSHHVGVALVAEGDTAAAGEAVTLALVMTPTPGWHDYWSNPGDAGVATEAKWTLPAGLMPPSPFAFPVPDTFLVAGLMNHVYERPHALLVTTRVAPNLAQGTKLPISAAVDWLACSDSLCVKEMGTVSTVITVAASTGVPTRRAEFDGYRMALPRPLGSVAHAAASAGVLRVGVPLPAGSPVADPHLFVATDGIVDYAAPQQLTRGGDLLVITTKLAPGATAKPFDAVLRTGRERGLSFHVEPGAVAAAVAPATTDVGGTTFLTALGGALLGGLLLNVMPCVFPILSLKALGLARSGESEAQARRDAIAYTAGVVGVCLLLGLVLIGLKAAGSAAGWAFQLTDPRILVLLLVLVTAIALNLAGLFELGTVGAGGDLARKPGAAGAFWTGALAAFVATPCAGPFLGVALGAATVLPPAAGLAVFGGLGLGLALPFLIVGFVPAIRRRLPRPGAWMSTFRHILSVPMFLTALALAWVLGREAGINGMTLGLGAALFASLGLWWTGGRQRSGRAGAWLPALIGAVLVPVAAAIAIGATPASAPQMAEAGSEPFSETRLATLRAAGRPVFVYFTADWCLICKVNERVAIERPDVAAALARGKIAVLSGDWTRGDPVIGRFLSAHGRSGVPFYLFYPAGGGEPRELPQVLTPAMLIALAG